MIKKQSLENYLVKGWTNFIDHKKLIQLLLEKIKTQSFPSIDNAIKQKGIQVKISLISLEPPGLLLWAEFSIPFKDKQLEGTCEIKTDFTHTEITEIVGNIFKVER